MKCPKCGGREMIVKQVNARTGAYCAECGAWVKWISGYEISDAYKTHFEKPENRDKVTRVFTKRNGITTIRCSVCKCQLYNSHAPEPIGQFNLLYAKFCPKCGCEFI